MYILLSIVVVLAVLVAAVLVAASRQPKELRVERSITTSASAEDVYAIFSDLGRWREWSPYDKRDPNMKTELSNPCTGVGATYSWNGNKDVGAGRMTVTRVNPGRSMDMDLEFDRPFKCKNHVEWRVDETGGQRRITWCMDGKNDALMPRIFGLIMNMDKMVGTDFEVGLATLKSIAEQSETADVK